MALMNEYNQVGRQGFMWQCNCVGPLNGEPRCPCQMMNVIERDGRWVQKEVDLGPVVKRVKVVPIKLPGDEA